ncbi:MAG TPA: hypothetical protein VEV17_21505, partial [Bryobacteraceae bacterium]|nr:hypothetical protein [Bryobacteraceae bacterium]
GPPPAEHFPALCDYGLAQLRSGPVLVNRTARGELQVFDNLIFHLATTPALEMRRITAAELRRAFTGAGFSELRFYTEDYPAFGILQLESWSLPVAARKQPLTFDRGLRAELMSHFGALREEIRKRDRENSELLELAEQRAVWAKGLDEELEAARQRIVELESDLATRTAWAQSLERELEQCRSWGAGLAREVESRTVWAQGLERQLQERTAWATHSEALVKRLEGDFGALRATLWNRLGRLLRVVR